MSDKLPETGADADVREDRHGRMLPVRVHIARDERRTATELAKQYTEEATFALVALMRAGDTGEIRLRAAGALLDRGWGRPKQVFVDESAPSGGPATRDEAVIALVEIIKDARDRELEKALGDPIDVTPVVIDATVVPVLDPDAPPVVVPMKRKRSRKRKRSGTNRSRANGTGGGVDPDGADDAA